MWVLAQARDSALCRRLVSGCSRAAVLAVCAMPLCLQQACEMVMDILRERDQGGFGDRNEYGSRIGGGIDVSANLPTGRRAMRSGWGCSS